MARDWPRLSSVPLHDYRVFKTREDLYRSPRTGKEHPFFVVEAPDWVNVVAVTEDQQVVLVKQFRFGVQRSTLEIPGGMIDAGEAPLHAAVRELEEESGARAREVLSLGAIAPNPAIQNNLCHSFLALGCAFTGAMHQDEREDIEVLTRPLAKIPDLIASGEITHALVVVAFHRFDRWRAQGGKL